MRKIFGALCVMLLVSGCASVATLNKTAHVSDAVRSEVGTFVEMNSRVNNVVYRLAADGASLCSNTDYRNPLMLYSAKAAGRGLSSEALAALYQLYGFDNHVRVFSIAAGAPVVDGVLVRGDRIVSIAGQAADDDVVSAMRSLQSAVAAGKHFDVVIGQAGGDHHTVHITPAKGCSGQVVVLATRGATTDVVDYGGDAVGLPADLVKYFQSDDALAFLVGRQLYYLGTSASTERKAAGYVGAAINGVMRALTFGIANAFVNLSHTGVSIARQAQATDADAFALKIMRAGGYDVRAVPKLWRHIDALPADKRPDDPTLTPSAARRAAVIKAIEKANAPLDMQAKSSAGAQ